MAGGGVGRDGPDVKVGITLPQFSDRADLVVAAARRAELLGIDGVFCFDHIWPIGQPGRPALSPGPLLGALSVSTSSIAVGTLVARVGLVPDARLVAVLASLASLSDGRFIAGIGTGDRLSRPENEAFGIPFGSADTRRGHLVAVASAVRRLGIPVWVGGGAPRTISTAASIGAAVNLWEGGTSRVAELTATGTEVTWGGPVGEDPDRAASKLAELAEAGATWAVCAWPESLDAVAEAADRVRGLSGVSGVSEAGEPGK
jgi:alkanesulfonate monooxygenase SsuD/methylene tetrahydromethanopterin reductase-like flavin-dependent oxidoreductase (luciferase family)